MESFKIVVLCLSGLALFYASSMRLINPHKAIFLQTYVENSQKTVESDTDLINEIRGVGAVMFLGGVIILLGTLIPDFRRSSFVVAVVIFAGVALGRFISFGLDGMPNTAVVRSAIVEIALSALNIFCLVNILRS